MIGQAPDRPPPTLREVLEAQAARLGNRLFAALPDGSLTFREADELADRTANVLLDLGYGQGQVVAICAGNGRAVLATWFACAKIGAVFLPVNSLLSGDPLRSVLAQSGARVVICDEGRHPAVAQVAASLPALRHLLITGAGTAAGVESLDALVDAAAAGRPPAVPADPAAPAKLLFTSGTTGWPRGVLWSRECEDTWARCYADELIEIAEGEGTYTCLPLFHVTAQGTTLATLARGGHITIDAEFDPFGFWARVRRAEARVFTFVGTILAVLARLPERANDADNPVRRIVGAAAPPDRWRDIERRFDLMVVETWGQTETASCWTAPAALPQRPGTVGRANWRFDAKVADLDGHEVPRGELGEMWLRPRRPQLMFDGYLTYDGTVSRESWTPDGWYRTGDLMRQHPDGDFSFVGRLRDAIRRRGEMIPAGEVEAVALAHPGVREAAAVGVPADDGVEEEIKLSAVANAGSAVTPPLLHAFLRDRLPAFMVPRYLDLRDELPTTPTTRIRKQALREEGTGSTWDARRGRVAPGAATDVSLMETTKRRGECPTI